MNIERKCMSCTFSAMQPPPPGEQVLIGKTPKLCLLNPPSAVVLPRADGALIPINVYPTVTPESISCAKFSMDNKVTLS